MWTCPGCAVVNPSKAKLCEGCGEVARHSASKATAAPGPSSGWPDCSWRQSKPCLVAGTTVLGADAYCAWHAVSLQSPRTVDLFGEFESWLERMSALSYCVIWTHYRADTLWGMVRGHAVPTAAPVPCASASCLVRARADDRAPEPTTTRQEVFALVRDLADAKEPA